MVVDDENRAFASLSFKNYSSYSAYSVIRQSAVYSLTWLRLAAVMASPPDPYAGISEMP
jgi:hypothetical protein